MSLAFLDYYRCPGSVVQFGVDGELGKSARFFKFGPDTICYGSSTEKGACDSPSNCGYDALDDVSIAGSRVLLSFDAQEVIENLQRERYARYFFRRDDRLNLAARSVYYALRPLLRVNVRKHLQRLRLHGWDKIAFPRWPIDTTTDRIQQRLMALAIRAAGGEPQPFIWFWPDGYQGCAIVTHDVEEAEGRDFCSQLMNIDESFGFKASFQLVPESRYSLAAAFLDDIRHRGFEVNVHDLTHDGRLFDAHPEFSRRAVKINQYGKEFGASGFRSGALYRNPDWFDELDFAYDMSIPNIAHLDPQRGGCCTIFPYRIGDKVELPLTCSQDYTLFHMLNDYSMDIWESQIETIIANNGLITILSHPDYLLEERARAAYERLLGYLAQQCRMNNLWTPLPKDAALWWQARCKMELVKDGCSWKIEGPGSERARIAYARLDGDKVSYTFDPSDAVSLHETQSLRRASM